MTDDNLDLSTISLSSFDDKIELSTVDLPILDPTYTVSGLNGATVGGLFNTSMIGAQGSMPNTAWTTGTSINWSPQIAPLTVNKSGKIELKGDDADIEINGTSMSDWMARIEERLNILTTNPKLEAEWDELRALGEQYRELEQKIKDKMATWDRLKAMPEPVIP